MWEWVDQKSINTIGILIANVIILILLFKLKRIQEYMEWLWFNEKLKLEKKLMEGKNMDLTNFIGLAGSLASIISFLDDKLGADFSTEMVQSQFEERARKEGSPESQLIGLIKGDDLKTTIRDFLDFYRTDPQFLNRINERCLKPYYEAIDDHSGKTETEVEEIREETRRCVCRNVAMARKDNGGRFPSDEFKRLWEQFECAML